MPVARQHRLAQTNMHQKTPAELDRSDATFLLEDAVEGDSPDSPRTKLRRIGEQVEELSRWASFNRHQKQAAHILLLGFVTDDKELICELVGCTDLFAELVIKRILDNELYKAYESWFERDHGDITFLLDALTAAGSLAREVKDGEPMYRLANLSVGVHVKHRSGFGSGWYVTAHKVDEDGQEYVRLRQSPHTRSAGGQWRKADNYVIA